MFKQRRPQGFVALMILESMEDGPTYGYEIVQRAKQVSGGHWEPSYGTIYGALDRLEKKGVIEPVEYGDHEDRQYYALTEKGRRKLAEGREWKQKEEPECQEVILGLLHAYKQVHGDEAFQVLLAKIDDEFELADTQNYSAKVCKSQEAGIDES